MAARPHVPANGKLTKGVKPNTLVERTMRFVEEQLPKWRDDKTRPAVEAEEDMNGQLCKFLNDRARDDFPMANFHHEEKQGNRRRVDMSAVPSTKAIEAALYDSIYIPFLVLEGKRLPPPSSDREREYVTGLALLSGGMQRFRMGLHGKALSQAVIIAYIQEGDVDHWYTTINGWIAALEQSNEDNTCKWTVNDALKNPMSDAQTNACRCESSHLRKGLADIRLVHLWICMPPRKPTPGAQATSASAIS